MTGLRGMILLILLLTAVVVWSPDTNTQRENTEYLTVRFLDVGQGDAIQVITPDGYELLIDGGPSGRVLAEIAHGRSFFDRAIDVVIATHPDTDHVAGLVDILERYSIALLLETEVISDSSSALAYEAVARTEGARIITAQSGQTIRLGALTTVHILSPRGDTKDWKSNSASIIVQIVYGDTEFLLTGDAPSSIEDYLVGRYGDALQSDVLKLGHHGSKTSTSELFLDTVNPKYAVVSAGLNNRYGHPHTSVVEKVGAREIELVSTAEVGMITFKSDGQKVWLDQ